MSEQISMLEGPWIHVRDGDPSAMSLFQRHYTARTTKPKVYQFVGPGEKMVLITPDARALFVWRRFLSDAGEIGVNCAVFRNEKSAAGRSSDLILAAKTEAWNRWPGQRLYTYVNPAKIRHKRDPGRCFIRAGFTTCSYRTKKDGKIVLEAFPV